MSDELANEIEGAVPTGTVPSVASGPDEDSPEVGDSPEAPDPNLEAGAGQGADVPAAPVAGTSLGERARGRLRSARNGWNERRELGVVDTVRSRLPSGEEAPIALLTLVIAVWAVVIFRLIRLRHARYGTFDFDEGIYDQYLWNLAHGTQDNTVRGVTFFGHHASYAMFLMVPLVWFGGGVDTWNGLHVLALGSTAFVLYALARDKLGSPWWGLAAGLLWIGQPTVSWLVHEGFHPDGMALPFLVATYHFGERWIRERKAGEVQSSTRWYFVASFLLTISWKEDLALALFGMGLVWVVRRQWRFARWVLVASAAWFVAFGMVLVPRLAGGTVYGGIYDLGSTPSEILLNSAKEPSLLIDKLEENDAVGYGRGLTESWAFVPLLSPVTLVIGAPMMGTNIISASAFTWDLHFHYQAVPVAAMAISTIEGLAFLKRRRRALAEIAVVAALGAALVCTLWYGPLPISNKYDVGYWPLTEAVEDEYLAEAIAMVPSQAGASAHYLAVPHMTHRRWIYSFPNPWKPSNYSAQPGVTGDPKRVDWLVLNLDVLNADHRALYESILDSGEFVLRYQQGPVVALQRVADPGQGTQPIDPDAEAPAPTPP